MKFKARVWIPSDDKWGTIEKMVYGEADTIGECVQILLDNYTGEEWKLYVTDAWGKIRHDATKEILG